MYLGWFCDDKAVSIAARIREAAARYEQKFGERCDTCLLSSADYAALTGSFEWSAADQAALALKPVQYVQPGNYWAGREAAKVEAVA